MKVHGVVCNWCKQGLISWYRHDFKFCFCGGTFIDGGHHYSRFGWEKWAGWPSEFEIEESEVVK